MISRIQLQGVKIDFPDWLRKKDFKETDIVEWMEYQFGLNSSICKNNPLANLDLNDCKVTIDKFLLDGKEINL
jgi:hypothetical protein